MRELHLSAKLDAKKKGDKELYEALHRFAYKERRSMSSVIVLALGEFLKREGGLR